MCVCVYIYIYIYIYIITLLTYRGFHLGHTCQTSILGHHQSLHGSMARASYQSSEVVNLIPVWGLEIVFWG